MSDIKVGDKVYLNPESGFVDDDTYFQIPVGEAGRVTGFDGGED